MDSKDRIRIQHMIDAATQAMESTATRTREDLDKDHIWTLGLIKCIEILGEAAARVSTECQSTHPQIPWPIIVGMRNRLVHVYFDVDLDQVWSTLQTDIPQLTEQLKTILEK
ncbi:MAG: DUF86 domain-containing protein [Deltaproteobacteria bacterium]|nr:DUF86 domain-containing protein [Deltaproteobacteria bacterium]MBN2670433.1 DUF86 domain-containing protein [Deltaproteobacteria bacterium]